MPGTALTLDERVAIEVWIGLARSVAVIADELDRDVSTVRRELARNGGPSGYRATRAQARADRCRARPKQTRLESDSAMAGFVAERLRLKDSPMTISLELAAGVHGVTGLISHETIYSCAYRKRGLDVDLRECLHLRRRKRKHRGQQRAATHSLGSFRPISERPTVALARTEVGHLEGDLITGAYNQSALITVFDRKSRRLWLCSTMNKTADAVYSSLVAMIETIPPGLRRTLTWDQGSELARHADITERCGIAIYIADKNSPWQRPTNENGNALVRRYVGKGTNLNAFSDQHLAAIEYRINTIPRRSLTWETALAVYHRDSAPIT